MAKRPQEVSQASDPQTVYDALIAKGYSPTEAAKVKARIAP